MAEKISGKNKNSFSLLFGLIFVIAFGFGIFLNAKSEVDPTPPPAALALPEHVFAPVQGQLMDLKEEEVEKAYHDYVSEEFKLAMPLNKFESFIDQYPFFLEWETLDFLKPLIEKHVAIVTAILTTPAGGEIPIQYSLVFENDEWKIIGFVINQEESEFDISELEELKELFPVINEQLSSLRQENLIQAYDPVVSQNFKQTTSFRAFSTFVENYPFLTQQENATVMEGNIDKNEAFIKVLVIADDERVPVEYDLVKEDDEWKIDAIRILFPPQIQKTLDPDEKEEVVKVIQTFFNMIAEGRTEKAYQDFTSKEFQQATQFSVFQEFMEDHPEFEKKSKVKFIDGGVAGSVDIVYVSYGTPPHLMHIEFRFIQQDDQWKILGMTTQNKGPLEIDDTPLQVDESALSQEIHEALDFLYNGSFKEFYKFYTTKDFKKGTSLESFDSFLKEHPILLKNPHVEIEDISIEGNEVKVLVNLSKPPHLAKAMFIYTIEANLLKIQRIETKPYGSKLSKTNTREQIHFHELLLGTRVDQEGIVINPTKTLDNPTNPIYINLYAYSSKGTGRVEIDLVHQETQAHIIPIDVYFENGGNSIFSLTFSPPPSGWPEGNYEFQVEASTGAKKSFPFTIEFNEEL